MPAFVKSSVGSSRGTTDALGTKVWPLLLKKSINCLRISSDVIISPLFLEKILLNFLILTENLVENYFKKIKFNTHRFLSQKQFLADKQKV
jgi:hypothetical protein